MRIKTNAPTITQKFPIEVPTHTYGSDPAVFKIFFGQKYLVWKGKSMLQACQFVAENVERYIRLKKDIDTDYMYHVCTHIKRTRCLRGSVEVIDSDFLKDDLSIDGYRMLCVEQDAINATKEDPMCLNNNLIAYMPNWMSKKEIDRFIKKYKITL